MVVVNIYGGPGSGKSLLAAEVFSNMKKLGVSCELVTEYAKEAVYAKKFFVLKDQLLTFAKQHHRLYVLDNQVDYVIVDSPLLLNLVYFDYSLPYNYKVFTELVLHTYNSYDNHDFFLERNLEEHGYQEYGRHQTVDEALQKDDEIRETLIAYGVKHNIIDYKNASAVIMQRLGL